MLNFKCTLYLQLIPLYSEGLAVFFSRMLLGVLASFVKVEIPARFNALSVGLLHNSERVSDLLSVVRAEVNTSIMTNN